MDNNLSRILYEVQNNLQWIATAQYNYSFSDFTQSTDTPYNLAMAFLANYERPADPNQPSRGTQAEYWYEFLGRITSNSYFTKEKVSMGIIRKETTTKKDIILSFFFLLTFFQNIIIIILKIKRGGVMYEF